MFGIQTFNYLHLYKLLHIRVRFINFNAQIISVGLKRKLRFKDSIVLNPKSLYEATPE
jgi:hypothetical protein